MTTDVSRDEYASDQNEMRLRIERLESKIDVLSTQQSTIIANQQAIFWKLVSTTLLGLVVGGIPYVLHLAGALK